MSDYRQLARAGVLRDLREIRREYEAGYPYDDAALSIIDALIRRVERWDE